jgi:GxxExxY protein
MIDEELTQKIIAACIEVHKELGAGLLESSYERCLCHELMLRGLSFQCQLPLPIVYKGITIDCGYRLDIVVEGKVVLEIKSIEKTLAVHEAQLLTYLKIGGYRVGLLVNFNVPRLVDGITRRVL